MIVYDTVLMTVGHIDDQAQNGPKDEERQRVPGELREDKGAENKSQRRDDMDCRAAEGTRFVGIDAAQDDDADAGAEECENRAGAAGFGDDLDRREARDAGDENADDNLDLIGRMELRVNLVQRHRHQTVAAHGIERAALREEHHQDDCRKAAKSAGADDGRAGVHADVFQYIRSRRRRV